MRRGRGWGGGGGRGGGSKKGKGKNRRKIIIYTNNICTYFVIQVATSPCTAEKPEVDYLTSYIKSRSSKPRNRVAYVCLVTVQLVSVTLQIVREMSQICDLCSFSAYI